jgi:hypothetical protein
VETNKRPAWLWGVLLAVFAIFLIILLQFRDVIYERFVVRLAETLWYARLVINSVSQELYFVVLLVIVLVTAFGTVVGLYLRAEAMGDENRVPESRPVSRARHWTELIYVRAPIQYTRELMNNEVRRLLLTHLGFEGEVDRQAIEDLIGRGEINVPPEVLPYLSKRRHDWSRPKKKPTQMQSIFQWVSERTGKDAEMNAKREPMDPQLERVVSYLESQLEVSDDTGQ